MILVYDGTFEGFLSLVHEVYYKKYIPHAITRVMPHANLVDTIVEIHYDALQSQKVLQGLKKRFDKKHVDLIPHMFLCDREDFELDLLAYIQLGFKNKKELYNINHPSVFYLQNLQKELLRHYHKYSGFLRFEELEDGTLYAKVKSKFSLVYLLGCHFAKRLNNQNFIIHDVERALACVKAEGDIDIKEVSSYEAPQVSQNEEKFQKLWQTFFQVIAIETRENKALQRQLVPLVYRTYMNEFSAL